MRVIASDESRARRLTATKLHGTSPRGEQSSTEAVAEVQTDNRKGSRWVRNRNNEGQYDRFVKAEKSEEWMARSPVWPDDVIASETASRHQPMNWRDSIWVQDSVTRRRSRSVKATQRRVTYERELPLLSALVQSHAPRMHASNSHWPTVIQCSARKQAGFYDTICESLLCEAIHDTLWHDVTAEASVYGKPFRLLFIPQDMNSWYQQFNFH